MDDGDAAQNRGLLAIPSLCVCMSLECDCCFTFVIKIETVKIQRSI